MKKFQLWLFGPRLSARMVRSAILTAIPIVVAEGPLSLNLAVWKVALLMAASAALTPVAYALQVADQEPTQ